jgi:hypothetical protein
VGSTFDSLIQRVESLERLLAQPRLADDPLPQQVQALQSAVAVLQPKVEAVVDATPTATVDAPPEVPALTQPARVGGPPQTEWVVITDSVVTPSFFLGSLHADWTSGTTVSVDPVDIHGTVTGAAAVSVYVQASQASYSMHNSTKLAAGTIIPYMLDADGDAYVVGMPIVVQTSTRLSAIVAGVGTLQIKTMDTWGAFSGTESAWVDAIDAEECADA